MAVAVAVVANGRLLRPATAVAAAASTLLTSALLSTLGSAAAAAAAASAAFLEDGKRAPDITSRARARPTNHL